MEEPLLLFKRGPNVPCLCATFFLCHLIDELNRSAVYQVTQVETELIGVYFTPEFVIPFFTSHLLLLWVFINFGVPLLSLSICLSPDFSSVLVRGQSCSAPSVGPNLPPLLPPTTNKPSVSIFPLLCQFWPGRFQCPHTLCTATEI